MKKIYNAPKYILPVLIVLAFASCDKDFSSIESDVLGEGNFNFNAADSKYPITSYNKKLDSLQINGLSSNFLGVYDDPAYGRTTASIVTQVTPTSNNPNFGENPEIESVILTIPYFSTQTGVTSENVPEYRLDSLFLESNKPDDVGKFKLTVYRNNYFLRNFNPNSSDDTSQNYYSSTENNATPNDNYIVTESGTVNFDDNIGTMLYQDPEFSHDKAPKETKVGEGEDEITTYSAPVIELDLLTADADAAYWKALILDKSGEPELSNANNFRNYFRGLYIKAEPTGADDPSSMALLNLLSSDANITITYTRDNTIEGGDRVTGTYVLNFSGNRLNTFINNYDEVALANGNKETGDETLYLKGTAGSMAVINLFDGLVDCDGDGEVDDDAFTCFKNTFRQTDSEGNKVLKRLINEAQIIVHESNLMDFPNSEYLNGDDHSANIRLYLYDLKNNIPVVDFFSDPIDNRSNPLNSKIFSFGQRTIDEDTGDATYKLRITDHLNNILIRDSTNVKLGLVVSTNVNLTSSADILNSGDDVTGIPSASVISPKGTILHGSNSMDTEKRLKFEIFFTEPQK